jgi:N-acetylmuramoyl-L-alanine amidase
VTVAALLTVLTGLAGSSAGSDRPVPRSVVIATARGETRIPVAVEFGHPALPAPSLARVLPVTGLLQDSWAVVTFAGKRFRFLLGAPVMAVDGKLRTLVGGAYVVRDTLFVPLQWLAETVPETFAEGYRYDPLAARFEETRIVPIVTSTTSGGLVPSSGRHKPANDLERANGFRLHHTVVIDAGHGGIDKGNPGLYLPKGVQEKHVALAISKDVRSALEARGVEVLMTRTTDTLINLYERAPTCRDDCDLFVSIHVNSMLRRADRNVRGMMTFFIGDQVTEEANRVAEMENEALRYESEYVPGYNDDPLAFIMKDLQSNEFLRESAQLAELIQQEGTKVHPGGDKRARQSRGLIVLRTATRPAVLVETGFATNRSDGAFLASREGQETLGAAIARGIVEYLHHYEQRLLGGSW